MERDTDRDWEVISQEKPYFGVVSAEQYRGRLLSGTQQETFFRGGFESVASIFDTVAEHFGTMRPRCALDFGCGVGRPLIPLAKRSETAVGVDVAQGMLELASEHARNAGLTNVTLLKSDDELSALRDRAFDFINSYIVLRRGSPPPKPRRQLLDRR